MASKKGEYWAVETFHNGHPHHLATVDEEGRMFHTREKARKYANRYPKAYGWRVRIGKAALVSE